jgi:hypothetical protein
MSGADLLLSKLSRVRKAGPGRWNACCPSHGSGRNQALTIRELPDGRILLHDFGGCQITEVLSAIGMTLVDLFPESMTAQESGGDRRYRSGQPSPWSPEQLLRAVSSDVLVAATAVSRVLDDKADDSDRSALWSSASRLADAVEALNGR